MTPENLSTFGVKYCSECEGEFVMRVEICPDCAVPLSYQRPQAEARPEVSHAEPVEVFSTLEVGLLPLVRATLEDAGIEFRTVDRYVSRAVIGSVMRETGFVVAAEDGERASALLAALPAEEVS